MSLGEGDVPVGIRAGDVEALRVGEDRRVPVRPAEDQHHELPAPDGLARRLGVAACQPGRALHRRVEPQHLVGRGRPRRRARAQPRELVGCSRSSAAPLPSRFTVVSNPAASRSDAILSQLVVGQPPSSCTGTSAERMSSAGERRIRSKCPTIQRCSAAGPLGPAVVAVGQARIQRQRHSGTPLQELPAHRPPAHPASPR